MTQPGSLAGLLGTPVRVATVRIGEVSGVFVDTTQTRAIGLEVATAGGARRFLPWVAATCVEGGVAVSSPLLLVDDGPSYERLGAHALRDAGALAGVVVHPDGRLERPVRRFGRGARGYIRAVSEDSAGADGAYSLRVDPAGPRLPRSATP